jgi:hypothetical protein
VNTLGNWTVRVASGVIRPQPMGGGLVGYRGNGGRALPPIILRHGTKLNWHCTASLFQLFSTEVGVGGDVNSRAHHGSTYLALGTHTFMVNTTGTWSLAWRP